MSMRHALLLVMLLIVCINTLLQVSRNATTYCSISAFSVSDQKKNTIVQLEGDLRHAGIYYCFDNLLTDGVINMMGLACDRAKNELAHMRLDDCNSGVKIRVSCKNDKLHGVISVSEIAARQRLALGIPIDLNRASMADLEVVPGIGPAMAQRIYEYRHKNGDFVRFSDLMQVEGIGYKKLHMFRKYLNIPE